MTGVTSPATAAGPPVPSSSATDVHLDCGGALNFFKIYLPEDGATAAEETVLVGFSDGDVDYDLAETTWCCYAWPVNYNQSGNRTFFVNQQGDVLFTEDTSATAYSGFTSMPDDDAAFLAGGIMSNTAVNQAGLDGNTWRQTN